MIHFCMPSRHLVNFAYAYNNITIYSTLIRGASQRITKTENEQQENTQNVFLIFQCIIVLMKTAGSHFKWCFTPSVHKFPFL